MELIGIHNGIMQLLSNEMKAVFVTALVFSSFSFIMAQTLTWSMTFYTDATCQRRSNTLPISYPSGSCQVSSSGNTGGSYNCNGTNIFAKNYRIGGGDCSGTPVLSYEIAPLNTCLTNPSGGIRWTCSNPVSSGTAITVASLSVVVAVLSLCL
jgi:hypothetical protein